MAKRLSLESEGGGGAYFDPPSSITWFPTGCKITGKSLDNLMVVV